MLTTDSIQADLDAARRQATRIERNLADNVHTSWIDRNNAYADLETACRTIKALENDLADAQRAAQATADRVQQAQALAHRVGNPTLAALLHIVYGAHTLARSLNAQAELRLTDPNGYTVEVVTVSAEATIPEIQTHLMKVVAPQHAAAWADFGYHPGDYRIAGPAHTPPANLADALTALADRIQTHDGPLTHLGLAQLISRVVDGPSASPYRASGNLSLMREMTAALVPDGFLSPVPDAQKVRAAAARHIPALVA